MFDSPLLTIGAFLVAAYLFKLWCADYAAARRGTPNAGGFPGATPISIVWVAIACLGAIFLVALETGGEYVLGVVSEQTTIPVISLLSLTAAAFGEELIFRGFIFYEKKGTRILWASVIGASAVFALLHYQYYTTEIEDGGWSFLFTAKAGWSLLLLFLNSLWFYFLRFSPSNPERSLIPCFAAHLASNLAVFGVKAAQGFVTLTS